MNLLQNRVTYRYLEAGGPALAEPELAGAMLRPRSQVIILIHGYNTSKIKADKCYYKFARLFRDAAENWADDLCAFHWPGDWNAPAVSSLSYPFKVRVAQLIGAQFARFLSRPITPWGTSPRLIVIAHSLGCRLTLEALAALARAAESSIKLEIVLMAAAVPVNLVDKAGSLNCSLTRAARTLVLYSSSDSVLRFGFKIGQKFAGEFGEPVGLKGEPISAWTERSKMSKYGHSEYWKRQEVADLIAHWLGAPVLRPVIAHVIESRSPPVAHELPSFRTIATRHLWPIVGRPSFRETPQRRIS
jgi:pimeloyl-ACP methyl ester carboxylesterase